MDRMLCVVNARVTQIQALV